MNPSSFRQRSLAGWLSLAALTATTTAMSAAEPSATTPVPASAESGARAPYTIERLHSTILNEDRVALIRLPRHYQRDTSTRYPVLLKLDGDSGLERYDAAIDILSCAEVIPDLIVVAIPNARGARTP